MALGVAVVGGAWAVGARLRRAPTRAALGLLALDVACNAAAARKIIAQAVRAAGERERQQIDLAAARLGRSLGGAHQPLSSVQPDLRALLSVLPNGPWRSPADAALARLEHIGRLLDTSSPLRDALADDTGALPVIGGHAARIPLRDGNPLRLYGAADAAPTALPRRVRRALRQVGLVLDEVRLLHNADIERSVFVNTLVARSLLVCLAPALGAWTLAPTPVIATSLIGDLVWAGMATTSLLTAIRAPEIVERAMDDSEAGRRLRARLLRIEVPLAVGGLVLCPAWTVAVFAAGWTNWWQRQTPELEFDWRKLGVFVVAVAGLQQLGLATAGVPVDDAVGETVLTLLAILVIGASYGAMLPLAIASATGVVLGDTRRSLAAARQARDELLGCARDLEATADRLRVVAVDTPVAARAAATARQAARQLERSADRLGRRGLLASQVLGELADEAAIRSFLPRLGSPALERARLAAEEAGEPLPAYVGEAIFSPPALRTARVNTQREARKVRAVLEWALNEGHRHGTGGVRVLLAVEGDRLVARVGNRQRPAEQRSGGFAGEGDRELRALVGRLPDGRTEHRDLAPPTEVGVRVGPEWFVVRASWSAAGLEFSP